MLYLDFEADTEKEATQLALESLGLDIEDVVIEPLTQGKKSFFGLGKKEKAKIRVFYKEKSEINDIIHAVKTLISKLDKNSLVEVESAPDNRYMLKIESTEPGKLIGKNGRTIEAIQTIVNGILQRHENKYKIVIDVGNYNERQMNRLIFNAQKAARQVLKTRRPIKLEPMNPFQRRLIHLEIQKMQGVITKSSGEGKFRTITITCQNGSGNHSDGKVDQGHLNDRPRGNRGRSQRSRDGNHGKKSHSAAHEKADASEAQNSEGSEGNKVIDGNLKTPSPEKG